MKYPKELVGLRGLAAAYVLIRHALTSLPPSFASEAMSNNYGVKLFMIVSGFSIFWLLDTKPTTYFRFIVGRVFRIFPAYLVALVVYVLLLDFVRQTVSVAPASPMNALRIVFVDAAQSQMLAHVLAHATLVQGLIPETAMPYAPYTLIGQAWSLSVEWQLYLVAPFAMALVSTLNRPASQFGLISLVAVLSWCGKHLGGGFLGNNLAMFAIGIASYAFIKRVHQNEFDRDLRAGSVALVVLSGIFAPDSLPSVIVWSVVILSATTLRLRGVIELVSRLLSSRVSQYLGRLSYSFYLFHMVAVISCLHAMRDFGISTNLGYVLLPLFSFALSVLLAEASFRCVEWPFHRIGKALAESGGTRMLRGSGTAENAVLSSRNDAGRPAVAI